MKEPWKTLITLLLPCLGFTALVMWEKEIYPACVLCVIAMLYLIYRYDRRHSADQDEALRAANEPFRRSTSPTSHRKDHDDE